MRKSLIFILSVLLVGGLVGAAAVSASTGISSPQTFTLTEKIVQSEFVDSGPSGDSLGDAFHFSSVLLEANSKVGHIDGNCAIGHMHPLRLRCSGVAKLESGQLSVDGVTPASNVQPGKEFSLGITGGTGVYRNARGYVTVHGISQTKSRDTFYVIP